MTQTWSQQFKYFLNKRMNIWIVVLLLLDSWRKGLRDASATVGLKV
jgi:phage terminase large subunit-like protein